MTQITDYTARFSYGYLMEIKVWLFVWHVLRVQHILQSKVDGAVYEELLKVLLDAERNKLSPSEVMVFARNVLIIVHFSDLC